MTNEEKFTSGRGGRPKGTTKEKVKKQYTFRLSDEELKAVREILAKMRGKLVIILAIFCMLFTSVQAETLQGGVTYTEETARQAAFAGVSEYFPYPNVDVFYRSLFVASINKKDVITIQEFNSRLFRVIPYRLIAVVYRDYPNFVHYYEKTNRGYKGVAIEVIDGSSYPIKAVKYDAKTGKVISVGLTTSPYEDFSFDADGKLIAHWKGNNETLNNTAKRKVIYSEP